MFFQQQQSILVGWWLTCWILQESLHLYCYLAVGQNLILVFPLFFFFSIFSGIIHTLLSLLYSIFAAFWMSTRATSTMTHGRWPSKPSATLSPLQALPRWPWAPMPAAHEASARHAGSCFRRAGGEGFDRSSAVGWGKPPLWSRIKRWHHLKATMKSLRNLQIMIMNDNDEFFVCS